MAAPGLARGRAIEYAAGVRDPLHGVTLKALLTALVERHGWEALARSVPIRCFQNEPSIASSLTFLRRTPWARAKVEAIYLRDEAERSRERGGGEI